MRFFRGALTALVLTGAATLAPAWAQDPLQELRRYDYQDRKPLDAIAKQIAAAGKDTAKLAALETGLLGVLGDPQSTPGARLEACTFLGRIGTARSVPTLARLLTDATLANSARLALELNADPSAGAALRAALGTVKGTALVGVIGSVGNRADAQALAALKTLTASADPLAAEAAVIALGKLGSTASVAALRSVKGTNLSVSPALLVAAGKLATAGKTKEALGVYTSLLTATQPEVVRAGALTGLNALNAPTAVAQALSLAKTAPEPTLQRVAARILGMRPEPTTLKLALGAFSGLPSPAQVALLTAWGDRREKGAAGVVTAALQSTDTEVQAAAIRAAIRVCDASVVPTLAALARTGPQTGVAREALARMGGPGVEAALLKLAAQGDTVVVGVLGQRPTTSVQAQLLALAKGKDSRAATSALKVLERIGTATQAPALTELLVTTQEEEVRDAAQATLVAIAQRSNTREQVSEGLIAALAGKPAPETQVALLATLAELGSPKALALLEQAASSGDASVKSAGLAALANTWTDSSALPVLRKLAQGSAEKGDRVLALRGSLRILAADDKLPAPEKLTQLTELFGLAERVEEKRQTLSVLREVRLPGAAALAGKALESPELLAEATDAILYLAAPQRKDRTNLPAVKGPEMTAALDKLIGANPDEKIREQAQKLRG